MPRVRSPRVHARPTALCARLLLSLLVMFAGRPAPTSADPLPPPAIYREWSGASLDDAICGISCVRDNVMVLNGRSGDIEITTLNGAPIRTFPTEVTGYSADVTPNLLGSYESGGSDNGAVANTIWVADPDRHRVRIFKMDGRLVRDITKLTDSDGNDVGQFESPVSISLGGSGALVLDAASGRVVSLSPEGATYRIWSGLPPEATSQRLVTIARDPHQFIWIADATTGQVHRFTPLGFYNYSIAGDGRLSGLTTFAVYHNGVVAIDGTSRRVVAYDLYGQHLRSFGDEAAPYGLESPRAVSISVNNDFYVVDTQQRRVVAFDPRGRDNEVKATLESMPSPAVGREPLAVQLQLRFQGGRGPFRNHWDLGDGAMANDVTRVNHRYQREGEYQVNVDITDEGRDVTTRVTLVVRATTPVGNPPRLVLHIVPNTGGAVSCDDPGIVDCRSARTNAEVPKPGSQGYIVYLLAARCDFPSVAGVQCGIDYDGGNPRGRSDGAGIDIAEWHSCGDLEFTHLYPQAWPEPGSGIQITWDATRHCQTGAMVVAGYFLVNVHTAGTLAIRPRPDDALAAIADCEHQEIGIGTSYLGYATFSPGAQAPGYNPTPGAIAVSTPTAVTTWSTIKALFGR